MKKILARKHAKNITIAFLYASLRIISVIADYISHFSCIFIGYVLLSPEWSDAMQNYGIKQQNPTLHREGPIPEAYLNNFIEYADIQNSGDETSTNSLDLMRGFDIWMHAMYPSTKQSICEDITLLKRAYMKINSRTTNFSAEVNIKQNPRKEKTSKRAAK